MPRLPTYFISHGGPNIMYDTANPAYTALSSLGRQITNLIKAQPAGAVKGVAVVSAHWAGGRDYIGVQAAGSETASGGGGDDGGEEKGGLIYDFYGFPKHYYEETFPYETSPELVDLVTNALTSDDGPGTPIRTKTTRRGLDHGVWASFKCLFNPASNPLPVPLIQVSLYQNEDPNAHYALGQRLGTLRDQGVLIIASGMAVHNLRDMRMAFSTGKTLPYADSFDTALTEASTKYVGDERRIAMAKLLERPDARQAHPHFDHLLPAHVAAGAAGEDAGKLLWTLVEASFSWAQFVFGKVENS